MLEFTIDFALPTVPAEGVMLLILFPDADFGLQ